MIETKLNSCFYKIFKKKKITKNIKNLELRKFEPWDSFGHINLILEIEKKFLIQFSMKEISELRSYKKILSRLKKEN
jgi:acyl carrier protein